MLSPSILRGFTRTPVTWISCGFEHAIALTNFGEVSSWGYGSSGCLGHGDYVSLAAPRNLEGLKGKFTTFIEAGGYHNAAITAQGQLYMWGRSDVGQCGVPKTSTKSDFVGHVVLQPVFVDFFSI